MNTVILPDTWPASVHAWPWILIELLGLHHQRNILTCHLILSPILVDVQHQVAEVLFGLRSINWRKDRIINCQIQVWFKLYWRVVSNPLVFGQCFEVKLSLNFSRFNISWLKSSSAVAAEIVIIYVILNISTRFRFASGLCMCCEILLRNKAKCVYYFEFAGSLANNFIKWY